MRNSNFKILFFGFILAFQFVKAQCGLTLSYGGYPIGVCDTDLKNVTVWISPACNNYAILWENGSTGLSAQLDTGMHYINIWDCNGCLTIDTFNVVCNEWNGTVDLKGKSSMSCLAIYPNPASSLLNIDLSIFDEEIIIEIFDNIGSNVKQIQRHAKNADLTIDVGDLPTGLYFVVIKQNSIVIGTNYIIIED